MHSNFYIVWGVPIVGEAPMECEKRGGKPPPRRKEEGEKEEQCEIRTIFTLRAERSNAAARTAKSATVKISLVRSCGFLKKKPSAHDRYKATIRERKMDVQRKMLVFLSGLAV